MRKAANPVTVKLMFLFLTTLITPLICLAQHGPQKDSALLPESWARKSAVNAVMPTYPEEAVRQGVSGVVRIRFETNPAGEVVTIKVKPGTDSLLRKAVIDSVKQWKFKHSRGIDRLEVPVFSRLAFHFILRKGEPRVEMYDPGPHPGDHSCMGCSNSYREMLEWEEWDEVWQNREASVVAPVSPS
jgi:TonB family protein